MEYEGHISLAYISLFENFLCYPQLMTILVAFVVMGKNTKLPKHFLTGKPPFNTCYYYYFILHISYFFDIR